MNPEQTPTPLAPAAGSALWQVWFEPTAIGISAFGWSAAPVGKPTDNYQEACFGCYELGLEEQSPDWRDYFRYVVRELPPNSEVTNTPSVYPNNPTTKPADRKESNEN